MATKTMHVRVDEDLHQRASEQAENLGMTLSPYVRMAVIKQVEEDESRGRPSGR